MVQGGVPRFWGITPTIRGQCSTFKETSYDVSESNGSQQLEKPQKPGDVESYLQ